MTGKRAALMKAMADQLIRYIEGVRGEGGVRRALFAFPDQPVVVMVIRQRDFEEMGSPESTKGPHKYEKQVVVEEKCGWCHLPKDHATHSL